MPFSEHGFGMAETQAQRLVCRGWGLRTAGSGGEACSVIASCPWVLQDMGVTIAEAVAAAYLAEAAEGLSGEALDAAPGVQSVHSVATECDLLGSGYRWSCKSQQRCSSDERLAHLFASTAVEHSFAGAVP